MQNANVVTMEEAISAVLKNAKEPMSVEQICQQIDYRQAKGEFGLPFDINNVDKLQLANLRCLLQYNLTEDCPSLTGNQVALLMSWAHLVNASGSSGFTRDELLAAFQGLAPLVSRVVQHINARREQEDALLMLWGQIADAQTVEV